MVALLVGIALAMGVAFATQAFALPCPDGTVHNGHYVCGNYEQ